MSDDTNRSTSRSPGPPSEPLQVIPYRQQVGTLATDSGGGVRFSYSPSYLARRIRPQLSLRMPLQGAPLTAARTVPFLDGLLPESRETRRETARALEIRDDLMSLLAVMGWDCPGAVQITPPDRLDAMLERTGGLQPVTEREIGQRISRLREHAPPLNNKKLPPAES